MSENRIVALRAALEMGFRTPDEVVGAAGKFDNFLEHGTVVAPAITADPPAAPPAEKRKRGATTQTPAASPAAAPTTTSATTAQAAPAGDMFGETAAATEQAVAAEAKPDAKAPTEDDVRAKLVAVQTAYGTKDKAVEQIKKVAPSGLLSALKTDDAAKTAANYAKVIEHCDAALKAAPKK